MEQQIGSFLIFKYLLDAEGAFWALCIIIATKNF
jgi:hypothetical protein